MKYIISGTNRPGSRTLQVSQILKRLYKEHGEEVEIIDLSLLDFGSLHGAHYGSSELPMGVQEAVNKVNGSDGLIIVCPEYNGSMPGVLKYFIDFWKYPVSFENRPVCFVGLGGNFGALRPIEHLQQVFGYRNAFVFPQRIFIFNIWNTLKDGVIQDKLVNDLMNQQVLGFQKFVTALQSQGLDANSRQSQAT